MATPVNDRDVLLLGLGASQRSGNPPDAAIILSSDAAAFRVMTNSVAFPSTITITANLVSLVGTVVFSATNATVTDNNNNTATLNYASMTGDSATITARITVNGQAYTKSLLLSKVYDGAKGNDGAKGDPGVTGSQYATAYLYQWYPAGQVPSKPTGSSGYTWASGVNSAYGASDGWTTSVPTNPGTPGLLLYVAAVAINAPGGTASTVVSYGSASVQAWAQNGGTGPRGNSGVQSATIMVYRWDSTIPSAPAGTATYHWADGTFGAAPTSPTVWNLSPGSSASQGMTLWAAKLYVTDSAINTDTTINWTNSAVVAVGYSGQNGQASAAGASYVTAYCASATGNATSAPATTTGKASLPAANSAGLTGTWSKDVPTLTVGQYLYQTDGIYDPTTDKVIWSIPYWSSLKVGSLSAISANLGAITAGSIDINNGTASIGADGAAVFKSIVIGDPANPVLTANGTGSIPNAITQAATTANTDGSIRTPGGAYMSTNNSNTQGAVKIRLPQSWTNTMMKFTVDIYEYLAGYSCTLEIAGYNYGGEGNAPYWINVSARVIGGSNVEYPVYFGHDGTKCCVWVGNANESWAYPQVRVRDFLAGFTNTGADLWATGWQISFDTASATNVTASVLDTYPAADWTKIPNKNGKPVDGATKNVVTSGTTAPSSPADGDIWVDTNTPVTIKTRVGGAWVIGGNVPTALSQVDSSAATKLSGVAAGATANAVTQGLLSARPVGNNGDFYYGTDTLTLYQKVSGAWSTASTVGATLGPGGNVTGTATNAKDIANNLGTFVSPGTARTQINDYGIQVFDGSNRLRIKIGQL